mgnify:CR=1 FL=1|jgi:hypothetical protein
MKRRTLRGRLAPSEARQLVVDDGNFNHGYKVMEFQAFSVAPTGGAQICPVILALDYDIGSDFDAGDNRQIGWSISNFDTAGNFSFFLPSVLDPDHVVIRDLYIKNLGALDFVNFLIVLEPMELTDDQAILTLIKERSQDDLR